MLRLLIYPAILSALAMGCLSCCRSRSSSGDQDVSASEAIKLATREFVAAGYDLENYTVSETVSQDSTGTAWIVSFDRKGEYRVPGGNHLVSVDMRGGRVVVMPGE